MLRNSKESLPQLGSSRRPESLPGDGASLHTLKGQVEKLGESGFGGRGKVGWRRALRVQRGRGFEEQLW